MFCSRCCSLQVFKNFFVFTLIQGILLFALVQKTFAFECLIFLDASDAKKRNTISPVALAFQNYTFPFEASFFIKEPALRFAIHEAFDGLDFYSGEPLPFDQMTIDHVIPKSKGGPNNIFNYVPTSAAINGAKANKFRIEDLETLEQIKNIYGPRVMKILESYGAFENRAEDLKNLIHASIVKKQYGVSDPHSSKFDFSVLDSNSVYVFRKKSSDPSEEMIKLLVGFAKKLNALPEIELGRAILNRSFQFEIDSNKIPDISEEELQPVNLDLSYRKLGAKLTASQAASQITLFTITRFDRLKSSGKVLVQIDFHPRFALKLLESPTSPAMATDFIQYLFKTVDINYQEFMEWHEQEDVQ